MIHDALLAILELLFLPFDTRPGRKASHLLWFLWLAATTLVLLIAGLGVYAILQQL